MTPKKTMFLFSISLLLSSSNKAGLFNFVQEKFTAGKVLANQVAHNYLLAGKDITFNQNPQPPGTSLSQQKSANIKAGKENGTENNDIHNPEIYDLIQRYCPYVYLDTNIKFYPTEYKEFFANPTTKIVGPLTPGAETTTTNSTVYKIKNVVNAYKEASVAGKLYFTNDENTKYGINPTLRQNTDGSLNTKIYAAALYKNPQNRNKGPRLYITYMFLFAWNDGYTLLKEGEHEADAEHITIEFDEYGRKPEALYYSAHGRKEGVWLDLKDIEWDGTHPIAYCAKVSHALYNKPGTYVRIYGLANDVTSKGLYWKPKIMRIFEEDDNRYSPLTMAWVYWPGNYGPRGISAAKKFFNIENDIGRPYSLVQKLFCPPINPIAQTYFISIKIPYAHPPE